MKSLSTLLPFVLLISCAESASRYARFNPHDDLSYAETVAQLEADTMLTSRAIGAGGTPSSTFQLAEHLSNIATAEKLLELLSSENPIVRAYAYGALLDHDDQDHLAILKMLIDDQEYFRSMSGCIVSASTVSNECIGYYLHPPFQDYNEHKRTEEEVAALDEILFNATTSNYRIEQAYTRIGATPENYQRIRNYIVEDNKLYLLPKLATYHKEADFQLLTDAIEEYTFDSYFVMDAVLICNDERFKASMLEALEEEYENTHVANVFDKLYKGLLQYRDQELTSLLIEQLSLIKHDLPFPSHVYTIIESMEEMHYPNLNSHILEIWDQHHVIPTERLAVLASLYPEKAQELALVSMEEYCLREASKVVSFFNSEFHFGLLAESISSVRQDDIEMLVRAGLQSENRRQVITLQNYIFSYPKECYRDLYLAAYNDGTLSDRYRASALSALSSLDEQN